MPYKGERINYVMQSKMMQYLVYIETMLFIIFKKALNQTET